MNNYTLNYDGQEIDALLQKIDDLGPATVSAAGTMSAADKQKLDEVDPDGEENVIESVSLGGSSLLPVNKNVNIPVDQAPTSGSQNLVRSGAIYTAINAVQQMLVNYYLKSETYSKAEVDSLIAGIHQFSYVVANSLPTASASTMWTVYLIPASLEETSNIKDEYITVQNGTSYYWEKIGSSAIDLSDYATIEEMNAAIAEVTAAVNAKYTKPGTGIPKTDLASDVQSSLGKADTAYQKPNSGIPASDIASGVVPDVVDNLTTEDATKALSAKQGKVLKDSLDECENAINKTTDLTSLIEWGAGKFIKSNGSIPSTSAENSVGKLDISNNFNKLSFNFSIRYGANYTKYGWMITDNNGNVLSHSEEYSELSTQLDTPVILNEIPSGAKYLYISWDTADYVTPPECIGETNIQTEISFLQNEKVSKDDIVDNLTTNDATKPLSAKQGKVLKDSLESSTDLASSVSWTQGRFIKATGDIATTSATNRVGVVDISSFTTLNFSFSLKSGGNYNKYGWMITDANGNVLLHSEEYSQYTTVQLERVLVALLPIGAKYLYVSCLDYTTDPPVIGIASIQARVSKLEIEVANNTEDIEEIRTSLPNSQNFNIENIGVEAFLNVRYDNGDYSYTKFPYAIAAVGTAYELPASITIKTPLKEGASSRQLEIADNAGYADSRVFTLDLVSETKVIYNLEGNKLYYYRVYYDNSSTNLISSGIFRTRGPLRDLFIPADNSTYGRTTIANVRDIGGWQTEGSKRLRYGVLFRGNELNHDNEGTIVQYVSQDGINELKALGVSAELDLRGEDYNESALGQDVNYANIPVDLFFYRLNIYNTITQRISEFVSAIRRIITWVKSGNGVYIHCQGGCDRTGALCAFIEGICGVSENDINHDYELSNRNRSREYYLISNGASYDGDFKFAMEYIKGLKRHNDVTYTKCRSYKNSYIVIGADSYLRDGLVTVSDVVYYKWTYNGTSYYTKEKYPTEDSVVYNGSYEDSGLSIASTKYDFYFNAGATVSSYTPVPITDAAIIAALDAMEKPTLKQQFRLLLSLGGLTNAEMDELEMLLCS